MVDDGGTGDGGAADAGTAWCGQVAPPDAANLCCASCTAGQSGCQANGCYGGWWCDTSACTCVSPSAACGSTSDGGTTTPPGATGLACTTSATYDHAESTGKCGAWRWSIKTGGDPAAAQVSLTNVQQTTIAHLRTLPAPSQIAAGNGMYLPRQAPTETQVWELRDVHLSWDKLEDDSDYHLMVSDGSGVDDRRGPLPGLRDPLEPLLLHHHPRPARGGAVPPPDDLRRVPELHRQPGGRRVLRRDPRPDRAWRPTGSSSTRCSGFCFGRGCDPLQSP